MFKIAKRLLLLSIASLVLLGAVQGSDSPSPSEVALSPHKYSLFRWEVDHLSDKWVNKFLEILPWNSEPSRLARIAQAQEFFDLIAEIKELERDSGDDNAARIEELQQRRSEMQTDVEETMESEISAVLVEEGFSSRIGVIFPPVDTVFAASPGALIISPRDRIAQTSSTLLKPGIPGPVRDELEELIFREDGVSALIVSTGGVATFPSVVSVSGNLHGALVITAHEWLHHWFFFQPLGQHFWDNSDMTTLNETAATIGGEIIGDRAFTAMTGEVVTREPESDTEPTDPDAFDFEAAMRETRLMAEALLAEGKIEEAESYMEERRQFIDDNGIFIRKINQAFFAFHGSYATGAASVSPIGDQLEELRIGTESLEDFLKTVAEFDRVDDLPDYLGVALPRDSGATE
ncbi:MAG: OmpH family outer membrane protein [Chloroflexi bacterium]|nr:OmpH family outer membrane protein [Chloroflexota bacterium]